MKTHLSTKNERRRARWARRQTRESSYGKRSAPVRPANFWRRYELIQATSPGDLVSFTAGWQI